MAILENLTVPMLKSRLRSQGLPLSGRKAELVNRLRKHGDSRWHALTVRELQKLLRERGLQVSGLKRELVARLVESDCERQEMDCKQQMISKRYQGNKSQPKDEAEAAASCPIFTRPGAAHPTPLPDSKLLRLFRRVPPDVIHSIHSLYWILVGGAVPRHLQEQSFVRFPSMEW
eukprot:g31189.t1